MSAQDHRHQAPKHVRAAVLTVSDTRTPETDASGAYLLGELAAAGHELSGYQIVRDEEGEIRAALALLLPISQVVISTGGTGIAGRDVTVPVVAGLIHKPLPGFGELFRMLSYAEVGGAAMLSRAVGGMTREGALLFALPGSLNAVRTAWDKLLGRELAHLVYETQKGASQKGAGRA